MFGFSKNSIRPFVVFLVFILVSFFSVSVVFAVDRTDPFQPGDTLDPGAEMVEPCGPEDDNCFVSINEIEGFLGVTGDLGVAPTQWASQVEIGTTNSDGHLVRLSFKEGDDIKAQIESARESALTDGYLAFRTRDGSMAEAMRITSAGFVGIGTTTPDSIFEIYDVVADRTLNFEARDDLAGFQLRAPGDNLSFNINGDADTDPVLFLTDDFSDQPSVGINTTSPIASLDIEGNVRTLGKPTAVLTGSIDPAASTTVTGVSTAFLSELVVGDRITVSGETRMVSAITDDDTLTVDKAFTDNGNDASVDVLYALYTARDSSSNLKFLINDSGNVALGSTIALAPLSGFEINENTIAIGNESGGGFRHWIDTNHSTTDDQNTMKFYLNYGDQHESTAPGTNSQLLLTLKAGQNGFVGIGNVDPQYRLDVSLGGFDAQGVAKFHDGVSAGALWLINGAIMGDNNEHQIVSKSTNPITFYTGGTINTLTEGTERMRIESSGNVGIATSSPDARLEVVGFVDSSNLVTNGTFTGSANSWILEAGWTYGGNLVTSDGTTDASVYQQDVTEAGQAYVVTFDVSGYVAGGLCVFIGSEFAGYAAANGSYSFGAVASEIGDLDLSNCDDFEGSVDNVVLVESGSMLSVGSSAFANALVVDGAGDLTVDNNFYVNDSATFFDELTVEGNVNDLLGPVAENISSGSAAAAAFGGISDDGGFTLYASSSTYDGGGAGWGHLGGGRSGLAEWAGNGFDLVSSGDLRFYSGGFGTANERMRILSTGEVGIAMADPSVELDVTGDIEYTGDITDVSDQRLKENISDITGTEALSIISSSQAKSFNMLGDPERSYGFIAQEIQEIFPDAVSIVDPGNGYLGISYLTFIPLATESIKQLNLNIESLALADTSNDKESFANRFFNRMKSWFADRANNIGDFFAGRVYTQELCLSDENGEETCITKKELDELLNEDDIEVIIGTPEIIISSPVEEEPEEIPEEDIVEEEIEEEMPVEEIIPEEEIVEETPEETVSEPVQ